MHRTIVYAGLVWTAFSLAALAQAPKAPTPTAPGAVPGAMQPGAMQPGAMQPGGMPDMQKMWDQMQQQLLAQFDQDKNGALDDREKLMAQEFLRRQGITLPMAPGGFPGADQFAKQFDMDRDGKLNPQEMMAAQMAYQRMMNGGMGGGMRGGLRGGGGGGSAMPQQPLMPAPNATNGKSAKSGSPLVHRFDKDGDGKLNAEEKAAAQAELKKDKAKPKDAKAK